MDEERWFVRSDEEWNARAERLKLMPCPHCKEVGALIRHGSLYGFDDSSPQRKTVRARRVFCSNRQARPGCGRTFSVWSADKIRFIARCPTPPYGDNIGQGHHHGSPLLTASHSGNKG